MSQAESQRLLADGEQAFSDGDLDRAASLLSAALDAGASGRVRAEIHNDLGVVANARGRVDDAEVEFGLALEHDPEFADAIQNLAELCARRGETGRVLEWQRRLGELVDPRGVGSRRLLVVCDRGPSGTAERFAVPAARALRELGYTVEIATCVGSEGDGIESAELVIHELAGDAPGDLAALVGQRHYDAILVASRPLGWPLSAALRLPEPHPRLVVVPRVSAVDYHWLRCRQGLLDRYADLLRRADAVCVGSRRGYDRKLVDGLSVASHYVPDAVEARAHRPGFRDRHGLTVGRPLLIVVGDLRRTENHLELLRALRDEPGDWQLALIGAPSADHPEAAADVRALAARDARVRLLEGLDQAEIAAALAEGDLLLSASLEPTTPPVVLDAMSRRLPWLTTPAGAATDEHAGGIMVPLCRFGEVVRSLLANESARAKLGESGYQDWHARHTWAIAGRRYAELLSGARTTAPPGAEPAMESAVAARRVVFGSEPPSVTCLITAHNYEHYVQFAIESVLTQEYPAELLDVVVTDDGSTDGTAAAVERLAEAHPGRVTLIRRENGGLAAATASAIAAARGDYLAICDADDVWLPGKVAAQARVLMERPSVTLCYGDMHVIDGDGRAVANSFLSHTVRRGYAFEDLARGNFTTNSTLMWRAGSAPSPIPESPYADYWIALHASMSGEVWGLEQPLAQYRRHGRNMSFGSVGAERVPEVQREVSFRRLVLLGEVGSALSLKALVEITLALELKAREILSLSPWALVELARVTDAQREQSARLLRELNALSSPTRETELWGYCRAMLLDPFNAEARDRLVAAWTAINAASERTDDLIAVPDGSPTVVARAAALVGEAAA